MRRSVELQGEGPGIEVQADDAVLVDEAVTYLQSNPATLDQFASWLSARGYAARVSIISPNAVRTTK